MLKNLLCVSVALGVAMAPAAAALAAAAPGGAGGPGGAQTGVPTEEQWNQPEAQAFVAKAKALAGNDPDLQFDFDWNCTPTGTHAGGGNGPASGSGGGDGAVRQNSEPRIPFVPATPGPLPPQHVFDNLWWFGSPSVGAWLITSDDGYILFDTLNNADEARDVIVAGMRKVGLDPAKIKHVVFGHFHLDHTGGGRYIEQLVHPKMYMGRDDWPLYFRSLSSNTGQAARIADKTPMTRGEDAKDLQQITVGDTTITLYSMPGHTPGSTGFIFNAKYQGRLHPILVITATAGGNNVRNRESFIGGYEHIWDAGLRAKVEAVVQAHPNYNQNSVSRMVYTTANYPPAKNPMLYGAEKTAKYIEITRACAQARLAALGW